MHTHVFLGTVAILAQGVTVKRSPSSGAFAESPAKHAQQWIHKDLFVPAGHHQGDHERDGHFPVGARGDLEACCCVVLHGMLTVLGSLCSPPKGAWPCPRDSGRDWLEKDSCIVGLVENHPVVTHSSWRWVRWQGRPGLHTVPPQPRTRSDMVQALARAGPALRVGRCRKIQQSKSLSIQNTCYNRNYGPSFLLQVLRATSPALSHQGSGFSESIGLEVAVILRPFWPKRHVSAPLPLAALAPWPPTRFDMGHSTSKKNARSGKSGFEAWNHKRKAPKPTNIKQRQTSRALGPPMVRNQQTSSPVVHNSGVLGGSPDESVKESIAVDHGARSLMVADHGWA